MKKTLLHVFPTFAVGGAQMRFVQLANHFGRHYRHKIVSMNGNIDAYAKLSPDLDVQLIDVPVKKGKTWTNLKIFRGVLKDLRPDLLVTSNWGSIEWSMANFDGMTRHLHMEDGFGPEEITQQLTRRVLTRRITLRRSIVMVPSMTLHKIARTIWKLPTRCLLHIPNGVDCLRFGGEPDLEFTASHGIKGESPVIGTVATLRAEKNLKRLIEAFADVIRHQSARLVIVGDGPDLSDLKTLAEELGITEHIIFTGACGQPEKLLPSFTVFALSSDTEQMPLSILEAMAAGLPIASTDVGDVRNMVSEENRTFMVGRESVTLAAAILVLLANPDQRRKIGEANSLRARTVYDQSNMFAAYGRVFDGDLS